MKTVRTFALVMVFSLAGLAQPLPLWRNIFTTNPAPAFVSADGTLVIVSNPVTGQWLLTTTITADITSGTNGLRATITNSPLTYFGTVTLRAGPTIFGPISGQGTNNWTSSNKFQLNKCEWNSAGSISKGNVLGIDTSFIGYDAGGVAISNISQKTDLVMGTNNYSLMQSNHGWFYAPSATYAMRTNATTNVFAWTIGRTNGENVGIIGNVTNLVAGTYQVEYNVCFTNTSSSPVAFLIATNGADANIRAEAMGSPQTAVASARGVLYLPANTVYTLQMSNLVNNSTLTIRQANLRVKRF